MYIIIVLITENLTFLHWISNLPMCCGGGCGLISVDCWMLYGHSKLAELHLPLKTVCRTVTVERYPASAIESHNIMLIFHIIKHYVKTIQNLKL